MDQLFDINLQFHADGGGDGAGAGGDAGVAAGGEAVQTQTPDAGEQINNRRRRANPLANVHYGIQQDQQPGPVATGNQTQTAAQETEDKPRQSFDELIKGEYKQDFDARVQNILRERFRKNDEASARMQPLFEALGKKYNVDASDLDALTKAIDGDDSLYEQEAMERGMSVESLKAIKQIERENAVLRKREETNQQEMQIRQHLDGLARQGEELKKLYPGFDLQTELRNPEFLRLTSPGVNVSVRTAYEVVHRDEMRGAEMQFAAQKSAERLSNSIRSNSRRPSESGLGSGQERGEVKTDPRTLSKADRAEIKRRVARGEKIVF